MEIKFRERDLQQFLSRCDPELQLMESTLSSKIKKGETDELLQKTINARREKLMPICKAAAVKFADLHDTTARMLAKGAIHVNQLYLLLGNSHYISVGRSSMEKCSELLLRTI